jgi:hypothetical protein
MCTGSYILPSVDDRKKIQRIKINGTYKKKKKKLFIKKHKRTSSWTRGLKSEEKKRKIIKCESFRQLWQETERRGGIYVYIFEPIRKKIRL